MGEELLPNVLVPQRLARYGDPLRRSHGICSSILPNFVTPLYMTHTSAASRVTAIPPSTTRGCAGESASAAPAAGLQRDITYGRIFRPAGRPAKSLELC